MTHFYTAKMHFQLPPCLHLTNHLLCYRWRRKPISCCGSGLTPQLSLMQSIKRFCCNYLTTTNSISSKSVNASNSVNVSAQICLKVLSGFLSVLIKAGFQIECFLQNLICYINDLKYKINLESLNFDISYLIGVYLYYMTMWIGILTKMQLNHMIII